MRTLKVSVRPVLIVIFFLNSLFCCHLFITVLLLFLKLFLSVGLRVILGCDIGIIFGGLRIVIVISKHKLAHVGLRDGFLLCYV